MAQVGSKVGPEMRKVAKVKLLKNHWFLQCFGPPGRPKMTPRGTQMAHLDPRGRQDDPGDLSNGPGDLSVTCQRVKVTCQGDLSLSKMVPRHPGSRKTEQSQGVPFI